MANLLNAKCGAVVSAAAVLVLSACEARDRRADVAVAAGADGWTQAPAIQTATIDRGSLVVSGVAEPQGRVVLRSDAGVAYGTAADADGRFQLRAPLPSGTVLLRPETQVGQEAAASPDRLLILDGGRGPIALLRPGGAARRLDGRPPLGAIDTDGRVVLASGFAEGPTTLGTGDQSQRVRPDSNGRWSAMTALPIGGGVLQVGDLTWPWPGAGTLEAAAEGPSVKRVEQGWRIVWATETGALQSTWLPDPATSFTGD